MAKGDNRLKVLYVLDIMRQNSKKHSIYDKDRFVSANKLVQILDEKHSLKSDRKSIYSYIETLEEYGCEFEKSKKGCYLLSCPNEFRKDEFETAELKMIADALILSHFYPARKTKQIVSKLEKLLPDNTVSLKNDNVFIDKAIKSDNDSVVYSIDSIYQAINQDKQISFHYYNIEAEFAPHGNRLTTKYRTENGKRKNYLQSPFHLMWKDDSYYLLTFDSDKKDIRTFRVDRMRDVIVQNGADNNIENIPRDGKEFFSNIDIVEYANTIFSMFGGETKNISLRVKKCLAKVIADKFGKNTSIYHDKYDEDFFLCSVKVQKSDMFFSWLSGFGTNIQITSPESIRNDYINYLKSLLDGYENLASLENQQVR